MVASFAGLNQAERSLLPENSHTVGLLLLRSSFLGVAWPFCAVTRSMRAATATSNRFDRAAESESILECDKHRRTN